MKKFLSVILACMLFTISIAEYQEKSVLAAENVGLDISVYTSGKGEFWEEDDILYIVYDDCAEVIRYLGTDGNMVIKPYVQEKPVTALSNWYDYYYDDGSWWGVEESIDSEHKVKRLVIPHTVKNLKIANWHNGDHHSLFEESNTLEELVIEDGAEISISSVYEDYPRNLNLIDTSNRLGYLGNLKSVYIGSGVKEISKFLLCGSSLTKIEVNENNLYYSSEDNILFNHDKTELIISGSANPLTEYTVPDTVEKIDFGFQSCKSLSRIVVGENVKSIGNHAFETESNSLELVVPYGSYAETYVKGLNADYIKYMVVGAPEQPEVAPTAEPEPEFPVPTAPANSSPTAKPEPEFPVPTASANSSPTAKPEPEFPVPTASVSFSPVVSPDVDLSTSEEDKSQETMEKSDAENSPLTVESTNDVKKPGRVKNVSATKKKKALKLKWKKVSGVAGYQNCYSTSAKFTKKSTKLTTGTTVTLKKLKARKKYYVKVRAYIMKDGKRVYGKYSKVLKKKTK